MTKNNDIRCKFLSRSGMALMGIVFLLSGCGNHEQQDLTDYIAKLKKTTMLTQTKKDITAIPMPVPATYQSSALRDPFEDTTVSYTEKGSTNPVNAFPLNMLRYTGMIQVGNKTWAVILVPDGRVYQLTLGDLLGDHYGKIAKIDTDHIEIMESATDEGKQAKSRLVTLRLKEGS